MTRKNFLQHRVGGSSLLIAVSVAAVLAGCGGKTDNQSYEGNYSGFFEGVNIDEDGLLAISVRNGGDMTMTFTVPSGSLPFEGSVDSRGNFSGSLRVDGFTNTVNGTMYHRSFGLDGDFRLRTASGSFNYRFEADRLRSVDDSRAAKTPSSTSGPFHDLAQARAAAK